MGSGKGGDNVVVAVRVRPFNDREKGRKAQLVVEMPDGQRTCIRDPNNPSDEKWFTFDHSYWSHDGFKTEKNGYLSPEDSRYADQKRVFEDLGKGILENAWAGYNCSLFAYGQTGSGKSYSIVGFKGNKGIVPIFCEELFKEIETKKENGKKAGSYEVFISMFEIYCEKIRDLLSNKEPPKGGLKLREHPKTGFYVENLSSAPVNSYKEIEAKIEQGTKNRTIAATNMNATSSRAHTIVKLLFVQKTSKSSGGTTTKKSEINLVDLAGSERQRDAGTEGDRMKEGIVINQSLSTLGRVIKALHEQQSSKGKRIQIAAISPADINYDETLSTLRFADRAKAIKTNAVVNENQTERLLRELREENERLQKQLRAGGGGTNEEIESLRRQLEQNQKEMAELEKTWQEKVAEEAAKERDPFYEAPDSKTFLGSAIVFLQPLAYLMDSEETYPIADAQGNELGELSVLLSPCNSAGKELLGEYVDDPKEIIGKSYGFMVRIQSARGLPRRIEKSFCRYRFFDGKEVNTQMLPGSSPSYAHEQIFHYKAITPELADYLLHSNLCISLWGTQKARQMNISSVQSGRRRQSMTESGEKPRPRKKRPSSQIPKTPRDENEAPHSVSGEKSQKPKKKPSSKSRRPKKKGPSSGQ
ncbi:hypothetical protein GCK32_001646 [Trichostrongylus colubriformis]|uniref:Kinesin-like protein n=1 Tax=Trichostrongylus colubriformis TaxID=6319 RepID=A0AAN8IY95_TRICO